MTRIEAIKKAAELKTILIALNTPEGNTNFTEWARYFSKFPMRSKKLPVFSLLGFIEMAEGKINHYKNVLSEAV